MVYICVKIHLFISENPFYCLEVFQLHLKLCKIMPLTWVQYYSWRMFSCVKLTMNYNFVKMTYLKLTLFPYCKRMKAGWGLGTRLGVDDIFNN